LAGAPQRQQRADRGVIRGDLLDHHLDPGAAEQADVRPGAAGAIDQPPRLAVGEAGFGVADHVPLQAAAGEKS